MAKVLIVDDDKFTRTVLETILNQDRTFAALGVDVVTAADGAQGLELFRKHRPDAVVLDLLMPKLDGFDLCREIRALPEGEPVHLAVISGVHRDRAIAQRLEREFDAAFFAKPYQLKEMTRHLADALAGGPRSSRADSNVEALEAEAEAETDAIATEVSAGELAQRRLPAVLIDLLDARATGRLLVRRGKVSKTIELLVGHPVAITSSLRDETLGQLLLSKGVISEAQHRRALADASAKKLRIGEALIDLGAITPEQLSSQLTAQLRHKLTTALRWPVGAWRFEPTPESQRRGGAIDGLATIITGLRDSADPAHPDQFLRGVEGRPLRLNRRGQRLKEELGRHVAPQLGELWRDGSTIDEMCDAGFERAELVVTVDILLHTDGVEVEQPREGTHPGAPIESAPGLSVHDLSEHSQLARLPQAPETARRGEELYDVLFDEGSVMEPLPTGTVPLEVDVDESGVPELISDNESGVIDVAGMNAGLSATGAVADETQRARSMLLREYLRLQGLDHYGVLKLEPGANEATISAATVERKSKFSFDWYARFDLGRDYGKLELVHAAYDEAFEVLMDPAKRAAYDNNESPADDDEIRRAPPLEAEIAFGVAEELLADGSYREAIIKLEAAVAASPEDATYLATLGWAHYLAGDRSARAADDARRYLNEALVKNPDSAVAHAFKGIIGAELGADDDEARFHLERALDADPSRADALESLTLLWQRAGEFRPLERLYRRLIYRTAGREATTELLLWRRLAELYRTQLDDPASARIAFESAARLSPNDPALRAALHDLDSGAPDRFFERSEVLRKHWRRDPTAGGPGLELMRAADQAARPDAAFMAASALVARGLATTEADELYRRYRPRFLIRAQRLMDDELWSRLRHPDDDPDIGALFELVADAVAPIMQLTAEDLELDETMLIDESVLPDELVRVRSYVAHLLGAAEPQVYLRSDFGRQIHVGALDPPVLLAGDDALSAPERSELGFRLGRAMTYLSPGRAIGGSRPSRFLKQTVLAAWEMVTPSGQLDDPGGEIATIRGRLEQLDPDRKTQIQAVVARITKHNRALNLSRWSRSLARTADRFGLLLCGDLPAAVRFAADVSGGGSADLVDFAISSSHLWLRSAMGLSIDV